MDELESVKNLRATFKRSMNKVSFMASPVVSSRTLKTIKEFNLTRKETQVLVPLKNFQDINM